MKLSQFKNANKLSVSLGPPPKTSSKPTVSVKQLIDIRNTLGPATSDNNIKDFATCINKIFGTGTVEKNFQKKLRARYNYFKKDFQYGYIAMEERVNITPEGQKTKKYATFMVKKAVALMKDVEKVRAKLIKLRGMVEEQTFLVLLCLYL